MKKKIAIFLIAAWAGVAWADGLKSLESFLKTAQTGRADFTQVVTSPPREGQAVRSKTSLGTFEFQRPARFRFVYRKPFEQTLVADGQTVWLYDVDLNQVSSRPQGQALGSTPAALLASAADLRALQQDFTLANAPDQDGQQWVLAQPRARDGQIQSVRIGFRGEQLATLDILDSFGQRSVLSFAGFQANPVLPAQTFQFKPPAGADVVRQ
ncbi:MAG: outer membrane lipoprotein chaperone LolA [Burkholderiaceae bacterium]|nr:outer membrane lipoprotein chaperone LolA [Burkholderiaceae bacterium]